jgi:hypothetical protein
MTFDDERAWVRTSVLVAVVSAILVATALIGSMGG